MKYLNLSEGFNPFKIKADDAIIQFENFTFSGGEPHIKLDLRAADVEDKIMISHRIRSFEDLGLLVLAVDAIRRIAPGINKSIALTVPYFPGARQDRRMVPGESLSSKVYTDLINGLGFDQVSILDPHSDVTPALLNNCFIINNHRLVVAALQDIYPQRDAPSPWIVAPDAGAVKKVIDLGKYLSDFNKNFDILECGKERDVKTGQLKAFKVHEDDLQGRDCVIVDDICDGGGTFLGLAEELKKKNAGKLYLIVSHGIFSKGLEPFNGVFEAIYTTDSFSEKSEGLMKVINLNTIM